MLYMCQHIDLTEPILTSAIIYQLCIASGKEKKNHIRTKLIVGRSSTRCDLNLDMLPVQTTDTSVEASEH